MGILVLWQYDRRKLIFSIKYILTKICFYLSEGLWDRTIFLEKAKK